jgi:DNA-binding response OmpR family regulator
MPIIDTHLNKEDNRVFERSVQLDSLAISPSVEDLLFLEYRYKEASWKLYTAHSYREGMDELGRNRVPVVLCEERLGDGDWKDVLSQLALIPDRPRLIVFSRNADERLWGQVLDLGGFDVLATPFRDDELVFTVGSAWLDWKGDQEAQPLRRHSHA